MKRKELKYYLLVGGSLLAYVIFQLLAPTPLDWQITIEHNDKNPFGGYVLYKQMHDLFPEQQFGRSNKTVSELRDSAFQNLMIIAESYAPWDEDLEALLQRADEGGNIFISAYYYGDALQDTLGFISQDKYWDQEKLADNPLKDSTRIRFISQGMDRADWYVYPAGNAFRSFTVSDSMAIRVIALNEMDQPVTIRIPFGKGNFYLNNTPLAFSNYYLLKPPGEQFAARTLSLLSENSLHWTEYYQVGRRESRSPLRYILHQAPLRWAYYVTIGALLAFMVFEARRRQRLIPVIHPLPNTTLDFVKTISNLYLQQKDHKNIAEKRINFFLEKLRRTFFLPEHLQGDILYRKLAAKTGHPEEDVKKLFDHIFLIKSKGQISAEELKELNQMIEKFN